MGKTVSIVTGAISSQGFTLRPHNHSSNHLAFYMYPSGSTSAYYNAAPQEEIRFLLSPHDSPLLSSTASGLLLGNRVDSVESGYYFTHFKNEESKARNLMMWKFIPDAKVWDNTKFDLHWLKIREADDTLVYGSYLSGIYSYPHRITQDEVTVSASISNELLGDSTVDLTIQYSGIHNATAPEYGTPPTNGPYYARVQRFDGTNPSGWENDLKVFYGEGASESGINITLPYYDTRATKQDIPAHYFVWINNYWAGYNTQTPLLGTYDPTYQEFQLEIPVNELQKGWDEFKKKSKEYDIENLEKIPGGDIRIPAGKIDRRRCSIGIKDVYINDVSYHKNGTYISQYYPLDFNIYTFSMKVDEFIPEYPNVNPYDVVQYFIEFNNLDWMRISPTTRGDEFDSEGMIVPKMFVFDRLIEEERRKYNNVKFIDIDIPVNSFRVKIVLDITSVTDAKVIPPSIKDYRCIIFDRDRLLEDNIQG